ncbi:PREDICTED: protein phosphatase 1 regulatory subunit 16A-like isoform X2 [Priapulus caudatus]|uniref:Protein phosphatase 1 regulatory subunit 16A-like isoform X2 n=1 Tax=Priapulus caudatus TaxID=37621 RepID=A0ABM1E2J5_PRICU|nr:PREDICTED: protein phosphatase 1 regulatory subunit 16A-like isoform X2 [Priapulus caudatus]
MVEHGELMAEIPVLEKMPMQERLKHARKRRSQQLKKYGQREKEHSRKKKNSSAGGSSGKRKAAAGRAAHLHIRFEPSVMLLEAAARNDVEEVRRLLKAGVSPDVTNEDGLTALHQCCIDDSEEMMQLLLEFRANVNAKDSELWTPLHAAATCGHLHLVKLLVNKSADLLAVNADGNMPYDICEDEVTLDYIESAMASKGVTQLLIDDTRSATERMMLQELKLLASADMEYRNHIAATPLHIAAANGFVSVVEYLLDNHVSLDVMDSDGWFPIHAAACWGHPQILEMLVGNGADIEAKTKNGETPYDICEDPDLKDRILELKSELEHNLSKRPLHMRRHSTNTRSQSIRRTSLRDKSMLSRREAQEEAKLRVQTEETKDSVALDDVEVTLPPSPRGRTLGSPKPSPKMHMKQERAQRSPKPGERPSVANDTSGDNSSPMERLERAIRPPGGAPDAAWQGERDEHGGSTGSIPGTLSDLKHKRRSSSDNKLQQEVVVAPPAGKANAKNGRTSHNGKLDESGSGGGGGGTRIQFVETKYKFSSLPGEVVGPRQRKKGCLQCVVL